MIFFFKILNQGFETGDKVIKKPNKWLNMHPYFSSVLALVKLDFSYETILQKLKIKAALGSCKEWLPISSQNVTSVASCFKEISGSSDTVHNSRKIPAMLWCVAGESLT